MYDPAERAAYWYAQEVKSLRFVAEFGGFAFASVIGLLLAPDMGLLTVWIAGLGVHAAAMAVFSKVHAERLHDWADEWRELIPEA